MAELLLFHNTPQAGVTPIAWALIYRSHSAKWAACRIS